MFLHPSGEVRSWSSACVDRDLALGCCPVDISNKASSCCTQSYQTTLVCSALGAIDNLTDGLGTPDGDALVDQSDRQSAENSFVGGGVYPLTYVPSMQRILIIPLNLQAHLAGTACQHSNHVNRLTYSWWLTTEGASGVDLITYWAHQLSIRCMILTLLGGPADDTRCRQETVSEAALRPI